MSKRHAMSLCLVAIMAMAAGCGAKEKPDMDKTPSATSSVPYDEAASRAQDEARRAATDTLGASVTLEPLAFGDNPVPVPCSDESDPPEGTPVKLQYSYRVDGADPSRIDAYFADFERELTSQGWKKRYGSRPENAVALSKDGYTLLLQYAPTNTLLSLTSESPCAQPKATD